MNANYSDKKMQRRTNIMKDSGIIPIWERYLMTVIEASEYYHIGENKLRNIIEYNMSMCWTLFLKGEIL